MVGAENQLIHPLLQEGAASGTLRALYQFNAFSVSAMTPREGTVLFLGPGPAEMMCHLAQVRPDLKIIGVDHFETRRRESQAIIGRQHLEGRVFLLSGDTTDLTRVADENALQVDTVASFFGFCEIPDRATLTKCCEEIAQLRFRKRCSIWLFDFARPKNHREVENFARKLLPSADQSQMADVKRVLESSLSSDVVEACLREAGLKLSRGEATSLDGIQVHALQSYRFDNRAGRVDGSGTFEGLQLSNLLRVSAGATIPTAITVPEALESRAKATPESTALKFKSDEGEWNEISWTGLRQQAIQAASGLRQLGLQPGEAIAIISANCLQWEVLFYASQMIGSFTVGIEPHAALDQKLFILAHSGASLLVVDNLQTLDSVPDVVQNQFKAILLLSTGEIIDRKENVISWRHLLNLPTTEIPVHEMTPESPALLIYTSGTTGVPKGIVYSQKQVLEAAETILESAADPSAPDQDRLVCWLPVSNLFQRMLNICGLLMGAPTSIVGNPLTVMAELPAIQPTIFIGVPRFYEKVVERIQARFGKLPRWAFALLRPVIGWQLKRAFGGSLRFMLSGSAPLSPEVAQFFKIARIPILEAYGLSENVTPIAMNTLDHNRPGSVGKILPGNLVKINDEGEVLVRGLGLARGYYRSSEKPTLDHEGFLATGDLGYLDKDGFLFLKGRKADLIKTSSGRKISPLRIENAILSAGDVDHAVVLGHGRKHLVAVITLKDSFIPSPSNDHSRLIDRLAAATADLAEYEKVRGFLILEDKFTVQGGHLTANLKVKRNAIAQLYRTDIDQLYRAVESHPTQPIVLVIQTTASPDSKHGNRPPEASRD